MYCMYRPRRASLLEMCCVDGTALGGAAPYMYSSLQLYRFCYTEVSRRKAYDLVHSLEAPTPR